ncbi:Hsp33 family molecular chaperone HslO [Alkaliphilus peptidifermentans]|uniref:33 kDa chaperonin n=1 Tax=Alkaliphilus peptidifermentans DSM 18978 TaxID=1120976 RepID=A0A1G5K8A9_9FIRM|nr:Hsp33 family molecular chaperone HslO [Alkaliphilus peptidifermentans]SCY96777.1 molecular chaperone Hsp33 [Alkaliphilus peptidifermentans DSM 18978]
MESKVIRVTASNNMIRGFFANTTHMVNKASKTHQTSPVAAAALGRTLTATSIMGLMLKDEKHKITVKINGGGPIGNILTVGDSSGNVKGYVDYPQVESTYIEPGKLNVGNAVGSKGTITVIKDLGLKEPYNGNYPLVSGEIGEDFAAYFLYSEQQPSAVALGVLVDVDYSIKSAGGFVIQVMPGISDEVISKLESRLGEVKSITNLIKEGMNEEDICNHILGDFDPQILEKHSVDFICDCSEERLEKALISLGEKELIEIIEEDKGAEMVCHFCNEKYFFNEEHLRKLIEDIKN